MIFRQLFEPDTSTYTYLLADDASGDAILIDPVRGDVPKYLRLLDELDLRLKFAVDTHVHADHVTALGELRDATGCVTVLGAGTKAECVSTTVSDGDGLRFGRHRLEAMHTPGHTDDSYCFLLPESPETGAAMLFSGDTLLIRGTGRTDFQNGDAAAQYDAIFGRLLTLADDTRVFPGHDYKGWTMSTIGEERRHNPRLQVPNKAAYIQLMGNLKLSPPRHIDTAVPANLACGRTVADATPSAVTAMEVN